MKREFKDKQSRLNIEKNNNIQYIVIRNTKHIQKQVETVNSQLCWQLRQGTRNKTATSHFKCDTMFFQHF